MGIVMILALAFGLAMDAFAVAISVGIVLPQLSFRAVFRLSWHFGFFQFMMPILGWSGGRLVQEWLSPYDHWVAFGLLSFIGGKMIWGSLKGQVGRPEGGQKDPTRGWRLVFLSVATSIDALAVGLSLAMLGTAVWFPSVVIGIVAGLMTLVGMHVGNRLGQHLGQKMELIGGLIMIAIGSKILVEHLGLLGGG